jgi:carboxyl-terminal processing protease
LLAWLDFGPKRAHDVVIIETYGKGSVQNVIPLSDGSSLHVTVAEWLTPNGRQITGQGLQPEVVVDLSSDDAANGRDPQLERAITAFR